MFSLTTLKEFYQLKNSACWERYPCPPPSPACKHLIYLLVLGTIKYEQK